MPPAFPEFPVSFVPPTANRTPLVGRARERAILADRLAAAVGGSTSVALVSGEPGVGKTRLLDALAADARAAGATVLRGGASDAAGMPPYLPFIEALGRGLREAPATILAAPELRFVGPLAAMLPELAARFPEPDDWLPLPPEQERR
ncbi:MAG TPA: ATP-binding protein, partial [Thermomicrobiales bacterium]|nr:ATP-binding protein [Thermomicrobiales bacterium]